MLNRIVMKNYVDCWMMDHDFRVYSWAEIEEMEGGTGDERCRTIDQALTRHGSWPNIWFQSYQKDLTLYEDPIYIYSLFWAAHKFSMITYDRSFRQWDLKDQTVADIGGSLFTSLRCLELGARNVLTYNILGSPQSQIIEDFVESHGFPIEVTDDSEHIIDNSGVFIYKAYLEHFQNVEIELDKWLLVPPKRRQIFIFDNSFCEIAYGHYIPIKIGGKDYSVRQEAEEAFVKLMKDKYGFAEPFSFDKSATKKVWRFIR